jgi:hypothetical protein
MGFRQDRSIEDPGEHQRVESEEDHDPEGQVNSSAAGVKMHLVRDQVSRDLLQTCVQLLEAVQAGHVTGIAFACTLKGKKYFVNVSGALERDPTFARGVVAALDDELSRMVQGQADAETTL